MKNTIKAVWDAQREGCGLYVFHLEKDGKEIEGTRAVLADHGNEYCVKDAPEDIQFSWDWTSGYHYSEHYRYKNGFTLKEVMSKIEEWVLTRLIKLYEDGVKTDGTEIDVIRWAKDFLAKTEKRKSAARCYTAPVGVGA